jgi:hypothetical protein
MACTCGHAREEHGHDPKYPGSTACRGDSLNEDDDLEPCDCIAYDPEDEDEEGGD